MWILLTQNFTIFNERVKLFLLSEISQSWSLHLTKDLEFFNPSLFLILNLFLICILNNWKFLRKCHYCYRVVKEELSPIRSYSILPTIRTSILFKAAFSFSSEVGDYHTWNKKGESSLGGGFIIHVHKAFIKILPNVPER